MLLEFLLGTLVLLVALCYRLLPPVWAFYKLRRRIVATIPSPDEPHWLRGHIVVDPKLQRQSFFDRTRAFPSVHLYLMTPIYPYVAVHSPEAMTEVLAGSPNKPPFIYDFITDFVGEGLISSGGKRWSRDRRLLSKAFSPDMLRKYVSVYKSASATLVEKWLRTSDDVIDLEQEMMLVTFDIIMQCAMGCNTNCQVDTEATSSFMQFLANTQWLSRATINRMNNLFYHNSFIFFNLTPNGREYARRRRELVAFSESVIESRRAELEATGGEGDKKTMLDAMLTVRDENNEGLSTREICDHVNTFLYAGHDTSSNALQWALYYLCEHQDVQEKCRDEVTEVLETCGGFQGFEYGHLDELQYVTQVIKETLRLVSPANGVVRYLEKETKVDKYTLPADSPVLLNIMGMHVNPSLWPEPEKFNPDHFSAEKCAARHPHAFIPFAPGARSCIGRHLSMDEMRVILASLVARFRIRLADESAPPPDWVNEIVSKPKPSIKVRVEVL